jgi:crotonobetainyl-CoA:carnitine CoA-transferase CaiB-like acyl-CoA transferase
MNSMKFLDGVRLVTMAQNVPGPLAVARLRLAGARVTKVEPPGGDPLLALSPAWHAEMHEGVTIERLDLKAEDARGRLTMLLEDADVFITSQRPSQLTRLGCDPDALRSRVPSLRLLRVVGSLSDPEQAGHDLTYQAHAGILGREMPRTLTADVMASERVYAGVLGLLRQPPGSTLDIGLVESLEPLVASLRHGLTLPNGALGGGAARYRVYAASVGRVAIAALEPHFAVRLYQQLNLALDSDLSACMRERTASEWESWGREHDLPLAAVRD